MDRATNQPELAVTDRHRIAAFEAMHWTGWTFEAAMADTVRSRVVNLRARQICNAEAAWLRRHVARPLMRQIRPAMEDLVQRLKPAFTTYAQDVKRAAAGDRDDD